MITLAEIQATGLNLNDHGAIAEHLSQGRVAVDTCSRESFATWAAKTGLRALIEEFSNTTGHPTRVTLQLRGTLLAFLSSDHGTH